MFEKCFMSYLYKQSAPKCISTSHDVAWLLLLSSFLVARPSWFMISQGIEGGGDTDCRSVTAPTAGLWLVQALPLFCRAFPAFLHPGAKSSPCCFPWLSTCPRSSPHMPLGSLIFTPVTIIPNDSHIILPWSPSRHIVVPLFLVSSWSFPKNFSYASGIFC